MENDIDFPFHDNNLIQIIKIYIKVLKQYPELLDNFYNFEIRYFNQNLDDFIREHYKHELVIQGEYANDPEIILIEEKMKDVDN
jgi:hypothetical protein